MRMKTIRIATLMTICVGTGCADDIPDKHRWIGDDSNERWTTVAKQLRGMDVAMVEIDYRYQELYWAGQDSNWAYADYQQTKIGLALENALVRRPKRRASAENLFLASLADMQGAVARQETAGFEKVFIDLTVACNACHDEEGFPSFQVQTPKFRQSSIRTVP
jgi:hypothetical protein